MSANELLDLRDLIESGDSSMQDLAIRATVLVKQHGARVARYRSDGFWLFDCGVTVPFGATLAEWTTAFERARH